MRPNYYGKKTLTSRNMKFLEKKNTQSTTIVRVSLTWWEKLRTFSYSWIYDTTNVFVFALLSYPFQFMLHCVLFHVMNMSILGTPCDTGFY